MMADSDGLVLNARHPRHLHVNWDDAHRERRRVSGSCAPPSERGPFKSAKLLSQGTVL
jgi:hypothetical protein